MCFTYRDSETEQAEHWCDEASGENFVWMGIYPSTLSGHVHPGIYLGDADLWETPE